MTTSNITKIPHISPTKWAPEVRAQAVHMWREERKSLKQIGEILNASIGQMSREVYQDHRELYGPHEEKRILFVLKPFVNAAQEVASPTIQQLALEPTPSEAIHAATEIPTKSPAAKRVRTPQKAVTEPIKEIAPPAQPDTTGPAIPVESAPVATPSMPVPVTKPVDKAVPLSQVAHIQKDEPLAEPPPALAPALQPKPRPVIPPHEVRCRFGAGLFRCTEFREAGDIYCAGHSEKPRSSRTSSQRWDIRRLLDPR
jgi:hypothetical protein